MTRYFYSEYEEGYGYGIWEHGGRIVEDGVEVDNLLFHVVDKIDAQTVLELLEEIQK